jgi:hypothetical protein
MWTYKQTKKTKLFFDTSPLMTEGVALDPETETGAIAGTPLVAIGKTVFTITARNKRGHHAVKIALAVAGKWQDARPKEWTKEMVQVWLKEVSA